VTVISILLCASASAGLAIGLVFFRVEAIMIASPLAALFAVLLVSDQNFGLLRDVLIVVGALAALQGSYLVGAFMRYLTTDEVNGDPASRAPVSGRRPHKQARASLLSVRNRQPATEAARHGRDQRSR
jgi:hypothetical protein